MKIKQNKMETYYTYKTSKGLKITLIKREKASSFHMGILYNFGGIDTSFVNLNSKKYTKTPVGVAHFLEHKMFESKGESVFEKFSKQSASINAYTNATSTVYYFSCTDKKEENIKLFLNCLTNPYITPENVEKEKGIIKEEINMYKDIPSSRVYENLLKAMYFKNHVRYDVAGEIKDIDDITYHHIITAYETFYNAKNSEIFVVGDINPETLFNIIENHNGFNKGEKALKIYPNEPINIVKKEVEEKMNISSSNFLIGFKFDKKDKKGRKMLKKDCICSIMLEYVCGNMSNLYERLYENTYIDSSFGYGVNLHNKYSFSLIGGVSRDPKKVLDEVYKEIYKLLKVGIEKEKLTTIKRMMIGNSTRIFDDSHTLLGSLMSYRSKGGCFLDIIEILDSIEDNEIYNCIKEHFGKDRTVLSIINPIE